LEDQVGKFDFFQIHILLIPIFSVKTSKLHRTISEDEDPKAESSETKAVNPSTGAIPKSDHNGNQFSKANIGGIKRRRNPHLNLLDKKCSSMELMSEPQLDQNQAKNYRTIQQILQRMNKLVSQLQLYFGNLGSHFDFLFQTLCSTTTVFNNLLLNQFNK